MNTQTTTHTPGPWTVQGRYITGANGNRTVADCGHSTAVPITEANARLIAAAPELYEALRELLAIALSRGTKLGLDEGGPVLDKARAAIAKAAP